MAAGKRKDPIRTRKAPHEVGRFGLRNPNENRKYVWASIADEATGVNKYLSNGYEVEVYRDGGVRPVIGATGKAGEDIVNSGMLLMSISKEDSEQQFQYGEDGDSGQALADTFAAKMFERGGDNVDRFRGVQNNRLEGIQVAQTRVL
jgi:hypothetical protein